LIDRLIMVLRPSQRKIVHSLTFSRHYLARHRRN